MNLDAYRNEYKPLFPSELRTDERYQRSLQYSHVKNIVKDFDINLVNPPKVSSRDGKYFIMDGDHTVAAWKQTFGNKPITCRVFYGLTWEQEAEIFLAQQGHVKAVTANEKLRTSFNMNDTDVVDIVDILKTYGIDIVFIGTKPKDRACSSADALYSTFKRVGKPMFIDIIDTIVSAWDGEKKSLSGKFIRGMQVFYETYNQKIDKKELIEKLKVNSPAFYERDAKEQTSGKSATKYARAFLKAYNKRKNSKKLQDIL